MLNLYVMETIEGLNLREYWLNLILVGLILLILKNGYAEIKQSTGPYFNFSVN